MTFTRVLAFFLSSLLLLPSCTSSSASYESLTTDGGPGFDAADGAGVHYGPETWWELGDSITYGAGSTPIVGYRKALWQWTASRACRVTFEGTIVTGDWANPVHDGHSGYTIENLQVEVRGVYGTHVRPADLVLLMVGTNNMGTLKGVSYDHASALAHYAELLDAIAAVNLDGYVLVTTIPPIDPVAYPGPSENVTDFNAGLVPVWDAFDRVHAHRLLRADVGKRLSPWSLKRFLNVHPNAAGYGEMALEIEETIASSGRCLN